MMKEQKRCIQCIHAGGLYDNYKEKHMDDKTILRHKIIDLTYDLCDEGLTNEERDMIIKEIHEIEYAIAVIEKGR